jgi:hypothetical protein
MKLIYILCINVILYFQILSQERMMVFDKVQPIAKQALVTLDKLVTEKNYKSMGFGELGEVKEVKLDEPIQVFMVGLENLKNYETGSDPEKLIVGGNRLIYPVLVQEKTRTSIEFEKVDNDWQATAFGGSNLINQLNSVRALLMKDQNLGISSFFAVHIPSLNLYFMAHKSEDELILTPILEDPGYGFEKGKPMPALKVFEILLPAAKDHNGLPG